MTRKSFAVIAVIILAAILALAGIIASRVEPQTKPQLGLMTSLPIYWSNGDDFGALVAEDGDIHWVRSELERDYQLVLLDNLAASGDAKPGSKFAALEFLLLAQPRPLSPPDFAALDQWVRGGGKVLIFADPFLTEHSDLALGDPRRPQGAALFSPIFTRWGLQQFFDERQPRGIREIDFGGTPIPVDQAGAFQTTSGGAANCSLSAAGLIADCAIGSGKALIISDAAMLDGEINSAKNKAALDRLMADAMATR